MGWGGLARIVRHAYGQMMGLGFDGGRVDLGSRRYVVARIFDMMDEDSKISGEDRE